MKTKLDCIRTYSTFISLSNSSLLIRICFFLKNFQTSWIVKIPSLDSSACLKKLSARLKNKIKIYNYYTSKFVTSFIKLYSFLSATLKFKVLYLMIICSINLTSTSLSSSVSHAKYKTRLSFPYVIARLWFSFNIKKQ